MSQWKLNTSNMGKFNEFQKLFASHGLELDSTHIDLKEIDADPITVAQHKASQLEPFTIIDDTSLHIEGANVGIHVRTLLDHLSELIGKKAEWVVLLAFQNGKEVFVYKGSTFGKIVAPKGSKGFGFDPVFLPEGASETLAEAKPLLYDSRAKAVLSLINNELLITLPLLKDWQGPWQK